MIEATIENLNKLIKKNERGVPVPAIVCWDGLRLSVQAGGYNYCAPRENDAFYYQVEVGYPSQCIDEILPYAEYKSNPTESVYGYVPIEIIVDVINKHGGYDPAFLI